jgi:ribokinase
MHDGCCPAKDTHLKQISVHVTGSINVDFFYTVGKVAEPGESVKVDSYIRQIGGKGTNVTRSILLSWPSSDSLKVNFLGKVGNDPDGAWCREYLQEKGFPMDNLLVEKGMSTGHCIIQRGSDANGDCAILYWLGANGTFTETDFDKVVEGADIILTQNEMNNIEILLKKAHAKKKRIFFNPSPVIPLISEELFAVEWLIVNLLEFNRLLEHLGIYSRKIQLISDPVIEESLRRVKTRTKCGNLIVTQGANGSVAIDSFDSFIRMETFKNENPVVDTVGAGDCFTGYLLTSILKQESLMGSFNLKDAMEIGSAAASIKVERQGAFDGIPSLDDVKRRLKGKNFIFL